jgi:hypothetical protein
MIRISTAAMLLAATLVTPAFAGNPPANNGVNGLNERGTIGDAPAYGYLPPGAPGDCTATDTRPACQQAAAPSEDISDPKSKSDIYPQPGSDRSLDPKAPDSAPSGY